MNYKSIEVPVIEEGACLLRLSGLPLAPPRDSSNALFFFYTHNTTGTEQDPAERHATNVAGSFKAWPVDGLFSGQPLMMTLPVGSFPEETGIRVIQFTGCDESKAKALMRGIAEEVSRPQSPLTTPSTGSTEIPADSAPEEVSRPQSPLTTPPTGSTGIPADFAPDLIFSSPNLDRRGGFITGISFREFVLTQPPQKKLLTLFVSIPHLGPVAQDLPKVRARAPQGVLPHSMTLEEYRFMRTAAASPPITVREERVRVYQTWFLLFDNHTIGIFRSGDDDLAAHAPLFPFQDRRGGVQALVNMLFSSITITERTALKAFRERATELEWKLRSNIENDPVGINVAEAIESNTRLFKRTMTDLSTILWLVRDQIQKLEELLRVIQNGSRPQLWNKHHRNWSPFEIEVFAHENEQMMDVHVTLQWMVEEREKALAQINALNQDLEGILSRLSQTRNESLVRDQAKSTGADTEKMQKTMDKQGQTISVFTYITTVFLPLGFFCSYYGINPPHFEDSIHNARDFWTVAGPSTVLIVLFMLVFLFGKDDAIKDWLKVRWRKLRGWRCLSLPP